MAKGAPGVARRLLRRLPPVTSPDGSCLRCVRGIDEAPCTCIVQDRCSATDDSGHQCSLGAGHTLQHVTAAGHYWR